MKRNLISEIKHIKKLMQINEVDSGDCEEHLEDKGFIVYNPTEQKGLKNRCLRRKKIKCLINALDNAGKTEYEIKDHSQNCYIIYKLGKDIRRKNTDFKTGNLVFWQDGDFSYIVTSTTATKYDPDGAGPKPEMTMIQYEWKGRYECDSTNITLKDMVYRGAYTEEHMDDISRIEDGVSFGLYDPSGNPIMNSRTGVQMKSADPEVGPPSNNVFDLIP